jgi:hypothetical protein
LTDNAKVLVKKPTKVKSAPKNPASVDAALLLTLVMIRYILNQTHIFLY